MLRATKAGEGLAERRAQETPESHSHQNCSRLTSSDPALRFRAGHSKDTGFPNQKPTDVTEEGGVGDKPRYAEQKPRH